ncbi:D-hexose-6-phosphate mutarotase [Marilutibacter maris]|uniref:glucose-6-phosphate 1-epimerase n=1 Tax=Marilutibacter maris TaxID=1605891 RepID=A0A2U9T206_9GAMM|nr:D-hexose-6-phosphate mutarotase [Lysobacter maris]AWV06421.1 aldose 1-epimerase [Lysobacter maris]
MSVTASAFGGQVLDWQARGREWLFPGSPGLHRPRSPLRGGVPVIFPQFAAWGDGPRHGIARNRRWHWLPAPDGELALALQASEQTLAAWPHPFRLELHARLAPRSLCLGLTVHNPGSTPFSFCAALHTYLRVGDIGDAALYGLDGHDYLESLHGPCQRPPRGPLTFAGPVDRVYPEVAAPLRLQDGDHTLGIEMDGFRDVVVWNPGEAAARQLDDLAPGDHRRFVCVEAGRILDPVTLKPGERWQGRQRLSLAAG